MSTGSFEAIFCTIFFVLSGYITVEVMGLIFPKNNDDVSTTKQILQYLMYSVINIMIYLPAIILLAKCLLLESGGIEIVSGNSKVEGDPIYANPWLWAMPNTALFCFLAIFTIIVESTFAGLCWAWIEKKYSRKRQGLIKGMSCWDKLFYDQGQMYVYLRLKIGGCLYGLWGREPSRVDTSFTPDPGIVVEQCDEKFTPLGTFIWISRENIALMQIIWRDEHE